MENPIKMDDLGVPLFSETSIYLLNLWFFLSYSSCFAPPMLEVGQGNSRRLEAEANSGWVQKKWREAEASPLEIFGINEEVRTAEN